ncbi:MAG: hypothetical protein GX608_06040 [Lentisphaerae bacterium]|nr:hypothetical protein [Lentisphaerota bacterium]
MKPLKQGKTKAAVEKSTRKTFLLTAAPGSEVYIAGTMNKWNPKQHKMKDTRNNGKYTITLMLPKGLYEYKFVVNGNWQVDPDCQNWVRNPMGTLNSIVNVD